MRPLIFLLALLLTPFAHAQWQVVQRLGERINQVIVASDTMIASSRTNLYFSLPPYTSWQKMSMGSYPSFTAVRTNNGFYFRYNSTLYRWNKNGNHKKIADLDTVGVLSASGNDVLVSFTGNPATSSSYNAVRRYSTQTGNKLAYPNFHTDNYSVDNNIASNDSVLFWGFGVNAGSYYGGHYLNMNKRTWTILAFENYPDIYNTVNMTGTSTCSMKGKGCHQFYYSDDYGKTNHVKELPDTLFAKCWARNESAVLKRIGDKVVFVTNTYSKPTSEIWLSTNMGDTWKGILKDSVITSAEVKGNVLYAATTYGTLIKLDTDQLVTSFGTPTSPSQLGTVYYVDGQLVNTTSSAQQIAVYDLQGRLRVELVLGPQQSSPLSLSQGCYALSLGSSEKRKILVY